MSASQTTAQSTETPLTESEFTHMKKHWDYISNQVLVDYWLKNFVVSSQCSLCGGPGIIDTLGVRTADNLPVGRYNWCICPNGRVLKKKHGTPDAPAFLVEELRLSRLTIINKAIQQLEKIVCVAKPDDGVVLLSNDGPSHYDEQLKGQVYDHEHFSPLGDALIELHQTLQKAVKVLGGTLEGSKSHERQ